MIIREMIESAGKQVSAGGKEGAMKKTYKIEVDCAACAAKKTEGVLNATVSFMTQKMAVEFAEGTDEKATMKAVLKACKKVESDCEIYV